MKYALIKNVPLGHLFDRINDTVAWSKYGFKPIDVQRIIVQGNDSEGNYSQIIPISNETQFNKMLPGLQSKIDTNVYENDSIEIIEQAEKDTITTDIEEIKAAE